MAKTSKSFSHHAFVQVLNETSRCYLTTTLTVVRYEFATCLTFFLVPIEFHQNFDIFVSSKFDGSIHILLQTFFLNKRVKNSEILLFLIKVEGGEF
jgi:hypothetical protein